MAFLYFESFYQSPDQSVHVVRDSMFYTRELTPSNDTNSSFVYVYTVVHNNLNG